MKIIINILSQKKETKKKINGTTIVEDEGCGLAKTEKKKKE
jgi:hypothetical protein